MLVLNSAKLTTPCSARKSHVSYVLSTHLTCLSVYDQYSFTVIPLLGTILAGDRASYQYLVESIRRFPTQPEFSKMIADAGFSVGGPFEGKGGAWRDLWGGIACIHTGVKV